MPVPGLPVDRGRLLMGGDRLLKPPHLPQRQAEVVQRHALAVPVPRLPVDRGRLLVGGDRLLLSAVAGAGVRQLYVDVAVSRGVWDTKVGMLDRACLRL